MFPTTGSVWLQDSSPLKILITRATYPSQPEPNYALNLEVAEYINQKKSNTPREAAMTIAQLVNHRNPHVAILALALLDTLVQSCGYPFQLQIATKEFLNELVRRFPERPPPYPGPVMSRILDLINGWKEGICVESRYKDDFGNIRDMHRLLTFKGYRFRNPPRHASSTETTTNLKTADELENEDREAQSAKLQELIRRGTPRDLVQAQELMKSLAGANPDAKPDYRSQALTELNKLESKVILLNHMLDNVDVERGERFADGDVYEQIAAILTSARPKIQGWISNAETDDPESLDTFLQINDQLNTVLNRYDAFKRGDYAAAANPIPSEYARTQNELTLIDFDDVSAPPTSSAPQSQVDELASLFGPSPSTSLPTLSGNTQPALPAYAQTQASPFASPNPTGVLPQPPVNYASRPGVSPISPQFGTPAGTPPPGAIRLSGTPQSTQRIATSAGGPSYFASHNTASSSGFGTSGAIETVASSAAPRIQAQVPSQQANPSGTAQTQGKDPFADLVGLF
ncbi:VHS domain-containing protein [Cytidiella melzeri]|nr:VHS domain-containing protein [Cytidiella melzeri]